MVDQRRCGIIHGSRQELWTTVEEHCEVEWRENINKITEQSTETNTAGNDGHIDEILNIFLHCKEMFHNGQRAVIIWNLFSN